MLFAEIPSPAGFPPRYWPTTPLPPYRYVPGLTPHPRRDPRGHSYRVALRDNRSAAWDPAQWRSLPQWLFGIDCFNAFFFWEAHEQWEALWRAVPRSSVPGRLLQGLIQIAAALLKIRLESIPGATRLSGKGLSKLAAIAAATRYLMGLDLATTAHQLTTYFRPLAERTLPPLDASVPRLLLNGPSDA
jgi:predicted metal-dependent hydrolase